MAVIVCMYIRKMCVNETCVCDCVCVFVCMKLWSVTVKFTFVNIVFRFFFVNTFAALFLFFRWFCSVSAMLWLTTAKSDSNNKKILIHDLFLALELTQL